jgi:hypothetical protein
MGVLYEHGWGVSKSAGGAGAVPEVGQCGDAVAMGNAGLYSFKGNGVRSIRSRQLRGIPRALARL